MSADPMRLLLVEGEEADARQLSEALRDAPGAAFELRTVARLDEAADALLAGGVDVILLDVSRPGGGGIAGLQRLHAAAPQTPIVAIAGVDDEELAVRAVQEGAQDCLVKGRVGGPLLARAIRYAVERKR